MRKTIYAFLLCLLAVAVTACGSSHKLSASQNAQASKATATADKAVQKCLPTKDGAPDLLILRTKAARHTFMACAVPPGERVAFDKCATRVILSGLPTKRRLAKGLRGCMAKAGV